MLKAIYSFILKKARNSLKIFEIEKRLKDIETRQKRLKHLLARKSGNIPPLLPPDHFNAILQVFVDRIKKSDSKDAIVVDGEKSAASAVALPTVSLVDYTLSQWVKALAHEEITIHQSIVPDQRLANLESPGTTEFIDMDVIPFALKKTDFLFIPSPYLSDYTLEFPAWLARISQKVNMGIFISVRFSNEDKLVNDEVKTEGDYQIRSILHKNGFADVLLLNPPIWKTKYHSKYSSSNDFYWLDKTEDEKNTEARLESGQILIDSMEPIPSVYLASRLPLTDETEG